MKLVPMKNPPAAKPQTAEVAADYRDPDYPYGLRISLDEEQLAALGLASLPAVGGPVGLEAAALVISASEQQVDGQPRRSLELQITDLALAAAGTGKFSRMYAADPSMKD